AGKQALKLSAKEVDLAVGSAVEVDATGVAFAVNPQQSTFALSVDAATAKSSYLPGASATVTGLTITQDEFAFTNVNLGPVDVNLKNLLVLKGLTLDVSTFTYHADTKKVDKTTAITASATEVDLFPGVSAFTSTVTGFKGRYDAASAAFSLSADDVKLAIGKVVQVDATNVGFTFDAQQ